MIQSHFKTFIATPKRDQDTLVGTLRHTDKIIKQQKLTLRAVLLKPSNSRLNLKQPKNSISYLGFKFMNNTYFDI